MKILRLKLGGSDSETLSPDLKWKLKHAIQERRLVGTTRFGSFLSFLTGDTAQKSLDFQGIAELLCFAVRANSTHANAVINHAHIHARGAVDAQLFDNADFSVFPVERVRGASLDA